MLAIHKTDSNSSHSMPNVIRKTKIGLLFIGKHKILFCFHQNAPFFLFARFSTGITFFGQFLFKRIADRYTNTIKWFRRTGLCNNENAIEHIDFVNRICCTNFLDLLPTLRKVLQNWNFTKDQYLIRKHYLCKNNLYKHPSLIMLYWLATPKLWIKIIFWMFRPFTFCKP